MARDLGKNPLQEEYEAYLRTLQKTYPPVIEDTLKYITSGLSVDEAVDKAVKEQFLLETIQEMTVKATMKTSQLGLGSQLTLDLGLAKDYYLYTEFSKGVTLSESIWDGAIQKGVKETVEQYLKYRGNVVELTRKIRNSATPTADIPKYLKELTALSKNDPDIKRAIAAARRKAESLSERGYKQHQIRKSYEDIIKAVESGKGLQKAISRAYRAKGNYFASRVARTEMARAYGMSTYRKVHEDKGIIGIRAVLSSGHPVTDICDHYTSVDAYNMGSGVYPSHSLPYFPFHPNCLCSLVSVRQDPDNPKKNKRYSEERTLDYLDNLSEDKRGKIIGVNAARGSRDDWSFALQKKGWNPNTNQPMTAKKVIKQLQ